MYRKTYAYIDCDILENNIKEIKSKYAYKYYIGVVKANAYGHGDYVVNSLIKGGVNYLAASSLEECLSIRKRNKDIPILCLEPISIEFLNIAVKENITITVEDINYFKEIKESNLKIHLKINSGMNRLGINNKNDVLEIFNLIKNSNNTLEGIYTHFATSGIQDKYFDIQLNNFKEITSKINLKEIPIVHLGRSLTLVNHKMPSYVNGCRMGIVMYGFNNSMNELTGLRKIKKDLKIKKYNISKTTVQNNLNLNCAFSLKSEILTIKKVKKDSFVGYGASYIALKDICVGVIPIGFADGIPKNITGKYVNINNKKYQIIGEVGMDMISVKIDESVNVHDEVLIYNDIFYDKNYLHMSAYTLFTSITNRVPRLYKEKDKITEIKY